MYVAYSTDQVKRQLFLIKRFNSGLTLSQFVKDRDLSPIPSIPSNRRKIDVFKSITGTRKNVFLTMVTTFGVRGNAYANELVSNSLTLNDTFWQAKRGQNRGK